MKTSIGRLRLTGFLEGWSFLILLCVAMPLKYYADIPSVNKVVGMLHGVLFIAYIYFVYEASSEDKWSLKEIILSLLASLIPFGTFYVDKKIFKKYSSF